MSTMTWLLIIAGWLVFVVWFNLRSTRPHRERMREYRQERASYVEDLKLRMYDQQNLLNSEFVHRLATTRHKEILSTHREQWVAELKEVLAYPGLVPHLTKHEPDILRWLQARMNAIHMAERADLDMAPDDRSPHQEQLPPAPKQALTPEERQAKIERFRESLVQRERTKIGDETAMAYAALELIDGLKDLEKSKIKEIEARNDLTEEEKDERIQGIRAMTQQRFNTLLESTAHAENQHQTDTPPPAVILGQP